MEIVSRYGFGGKIALAKTLQLMQWLYLGKPKYKSPTPTLLLTRIQNFRIMLISFNDMKQHRLNKHVTSMHVTMKPPISSSD